MHTSVTNRDGLVYPVEKCLKVCTRIRNRKTSKIVPSFYKYCAKNAGSLNVFCQKKCILQTLFRVFDRKLKLGSTYVTFEPLRLPKNLLF